ncbi:glycosyltransferase family 4 protein [Microbacterium sp. E-13]|uniref:glycosyltransferase family 4 protein n=1 Tax=Microbacterium sp. E-13 TaxID=3404048 RepID=UPI003CF79177
MARIVQLAPFIGPGSGVPGVAYDLGREFRALGHQVESFTFTTARAGRPDPFRARGRWSARALQSWRTVWFSTVGTRRARAFLAARPDAVSICHGKVVAGDVYVNHGVLLAAMHAHGSGIGGFLRDPTHLFSFVRDRARLRSDVHRRVVCLTEEEVAALTRTFGRVRPPVVVIPNGVDLERFRPPASAARRAARERLGLDAEHRVALFVGHEFERKGLYLAMEALVQATTVLLLVVGGTRSMVARAQREAERVGVADRVLLLGQQSDLSAYFAAADMFVLPSSYESSGLVFLEALASGLPVVATRVGIAPEVVEDGRNGWLVDRDPLELAQRLEELAAAEPGSFTEAARRSAEPYGWRSIAERYVELLDTVRAEREAGARA